MKYKAYRTCASKRSALQKSIPVLLCSLIFNFSYLHTTAASIVLNGSDAVVWLQQQTVHGRLQGFFTKQLTATCNGRSFQIRVKNDSAFSFAVSLQVGVNNIQVYTQNKAHNIAPVTRTFTLGFKPEPLVQPYAVFKNNKLTLHRKLRHNPWKDPLNYLWTEDSANPASCRIEKAAGQIAVVHLPPANGIYYFTLNVYTAKDTARFKTFVVKADSGVQVFNIEKDHAPWIDEAIMYEITPSAFVQAGGYDAITGKLEELKILGINTIWLQPLYQTARRGQGYDVTDYFSLREDFGTEQQLRALIDKAKSLQLRVLFDFVPNHTSVQHPYAQDCIKRGTASHYYYFYQHESDGAPYSSLYKKTKDGFIIYFWEDLVNLNYNNEEVQRWMIEACKYWVKKFDIDGYRFDAVWAVNARAPHFAKRLQMELKAAKPDLLLLAEDKSVPAAYKAGFDAAYDWAADTGWVSHWSWQYEYDDRKSFTVFNHPDVTKRPRLLRQAIFGSGDTNLRLRFLENNDLPRFVKDHNLAQTKMAAALLFALPGIPMLYNGQETGYARHPYTRHSVFEKGKTIQSLDSNNLFPFYQRLIRLRKKHPALQSGHISPLPVAPEQKVLAFRRTKGSEEFIVLLNMDSLPVTAVVDLPQKAGPQDFVLEDVLTGASFYIKNTATEIPLTGYGIRWLRIK